jgi:hypothetical protein
MELINRVESFIKLGNYITEDSEELQSIICLTGIKNHWFTKDNCYLAMNAITQTMLNEEKLKNWLQVYNLENVKTKSVGIIAAGNIPLVSFHDVLCVLISGQKLYLKTSDRDNVLLPHFLDKLISFDAEWANNIFIDQRWTKMDAVIATGSNNSGRYFEYYFGKNPHIIRKNRHSIAVLNGNESEEELYQLGLDVFEYFGLGCRNVSMIWIPKDYKYETLLKAWKPFEKLMMFHSYKNNLDYQRTIYLMNGTTIVDCDFVNLIEVKAISSAISCVNLVHYENTTEIIDWLKIHDEEIQCVVNFDQFERNVSFGEAQAPELNDYADGIDTMQFLIELK